MTETEFIEALNKKDEVIVGLSKNVEQLTIETAKLREEICEQNYYIRKLEAKLTEAGAW